MTTMLAAFLPGNSTVDLREVPVPQPGIGQVLVRMRASGICGSDIHYIYHKHLGDDPRTSYQGVVAGHEPAGEVVERGAGCRHFKPGDRVAVYHISGCGFCRNCRQAASRSPATTRCAPPMAGSATAAMRPTSIADERDLVHLPDSLSFRDGCFISCGVGTAYEAVLRGNVSGSDAVLVVGLGPGRHGGPDARQGAAGPKASSAWTCSPSASRRHASSGCWTMASWRNPTTLDAINDADEAAALRWPSTARAIRAGACWRCGRRAPGAAASTSARPARCSSTSATICFTGSARSMVHGSRASTTWTSAARISTPGACTRTTSSPTAFRWNRRPEAYSLMAGGRCRAGGHRVRGGGHKRSRWIFLVGRCGSGARRNDHGRVVSGASLPSAAARTCRFSANRARAPGKPHCNPPVFRWCPSATASATITHRSTDTLRAHPQHAGWDRHSSAWRRLDRANGTRSSKRRGSLTLLGFDHRQPNGAPYTYSANQSFVLAGPTLDA